MKFQSYSLPTAAIAVILVISLLGTSVKGAQGDAESQETPFLLKRLRREGWGNSWRILSPAAAQQCYARPCWYDEDCCRGYRCSEITDIERRSQPPRTCAPIMEGGFGRFG